MTRRGDGLPTRPSWAIATVVALLAMVAVGCFGSDVSPGGSIVPPSDGRLASPLSATAAPNPPSVASPSEPTTPPPSASSPIPSRAPTPSSSLPHEDAALEALLPTSLGGVPLIRFSLPASFFTTGGDMCILLCGDEPTRFAEQLGIPPGNITIAFATDERLGVGVIAFRARGARTDRLVPAHVAIKGMTGTASGPSWPVLIGGRSATFLLQFPVERGEYLIADGDVLFDIPGDSPTSNGSFDPRGATFPEHVVEAVSGLP